MKKQRIEKDYIFNGFGFPIVLQNVPMMNIRGIWTANIKWNRLEKIVLLLLAHKPEELTGNQIRFVRHTMNMNQREFAELFHTTHVAVVKEEKSSDFPAKMQTTTELAIHLSILDQLIKDDKEFRLAYHNLLALPFSHKIKPLEVNTQTDLIAI